MEQVSLLHYAAAISGGEFSQACTRTRFYRITFTPGLAVSIHPTMCKKRTCEDCGWFWAWKWRQALAEKAADLERQVLPPIQRAITLTTKYDPGYEKIWMALKYFWRFIRRYSPDVEEWWKPGRPVLTEKAIKAGITKPRRPYANIQYWMVVEYNQKKTQPHLHCVIYNENDLKRGYVPKDVIKEAWRKAQEQAKFRLIAWDTRIEKIKGTVRQYFTKYITKLTGGKDEIPPAAWRGRYVRYSRQFFGGISAAAMLARLALEKFMEAPSGDRSYFIFGESVTLADFINLARQAKEDCDRAVRATWSPGEDKERATTYIPEMFPPPPPPEKPPRLALLRERSAPSVQTYCNLPIKSDLALQTDLYCPLPVKPASDRVSHFAELIPETRIFLD